ncbi:MAG: Uma2 family endonuclease [Candidatus Eremiobacteraeota bacterium]|nr:Uma2 family endonuclease [Candidatus Eremiobacteraeota bacterium]
MTYEGVRKVIQRTYPAYDVEIREGEYHIVAPHDMVSSNIVMRLGRRLGAWVESQNLGNVFDSNGGLVFPDGDKMAPDLTYVSRERLPVIPRSFAHVVPELVVEVRSSRQTERATRRKLETLLDKGVDVGIYIDPSSRVVEIHRAGRAPLNVAPGDRFELPDILPGFSVSVDEFWPE